MALVATTESFVTHKQSIAKYKRYVKPNLTSNGIWLSDGYSCRAISTMSDTSYAYKVFNGGWSSYCDKFNEGAYIEICLPQPLEIAEINISSSDGYLPANGEVYYSDNGEDYVKCGTWEDILGTSKSATATIDSTTGKHRIWRLKSTSRALKHPTNNADISSATLWYYECFEVNETLPEGVGGWVNTYFTHIPHNGLDVRAVTPYITTRKAVDEATPEGISGWVNAYITCIPHIGMDINELNVYATYRRDDKVDLTEGMDDAQITGYMSAYATYKPHDGLDVLGSFAYITYRPKEYTSDVVFCGDEFLNENTMKNGGVLLNGENHWVTMLSRYMDKSYVNTSLEGDEIANIKNSLDDRIFQYKPTHVFIEGGTNDCINGATAEVTQENMRDVIQKLLEKDIQVALVWLPVNKSQSSELDALLEKYKQIADEFSVTHPAYFRFLNLEGIADNEEYIDDFHLYQAGHKAITEGILTVIGTMPSYMKNKYAIYSAPMYPLRFMFPY